MILLLENCSLYLNGVIISDKGSRVILYTPKDYIQIQNEFILYPQLVDLLTGSEVSIPKDELDKLVKLGTLL
jgi:hypothetical protein